MIPPVQVGNKPVVFISSRLGEFAEARVALDKAIQDKFDYRTFRFEERARPHPPRKTYRAGIEQSQFFVGIYGVGYGWVDDDAGMDISGIHDEWRLADGVPRLVFVMKTDVPRDPRLHSLLQEIGKDVSYVEFSTTDELVSAALIAIQGLAHELILTASSTATTRRTEGRQELIRTYATRHIRECAFYTEALAGALKSSRRVFITGRPGSGKTAALFLLAKENPSVYVSVRNMPLLRLAADIANGIATLTGKAPAEYTSVEDALAACERAIRTSGVRVLVDDVDQNPDVTYSLLTIGAGSGSIVFAGRKVPHGMPLDVTLVECQGFTEGEALSYLSEAVSGIDAERIKDVVKRADGNPFYLSLFASRPGEDAPVSLAGYHSRIYDGIPSPGKELLGILAFAQIPLRCDDLAGAISSYRNQTVSAIAVQQEVATIGEVVIQSGEYLRVFHPAFQEYVIDRHRHDGTCYSLHRALASMFVRRGELHLRVFHEVSAGECPSDAGQLAEAWSMAHVTGFMKIARTLLAKDIKVARAESDRRRAGYALFHASVIKRDRVSGLAALRIVSLAEKHFLSCGNTEWAMIAENLKATFLVNADRGPEGLDILKKAAHHWHEAGLADAEAMARTNLGYVYIKLGRLLEAEAECRKAGELHAATGNTFGRALALLNLNTVHIARQDNDRVLSTATELLRLAARLHSPRVAAAAHNALTAYYRRKGKLERARAEAEKAVAIAESLCDWDCLATNKGNLGNVYGDQKKCREAERCYQEARALGVKHGSREHVAMATKMLADLAEEEGKDSAAVELGNEAVAEYRLAGNSYRIGTSASDQGARILRIAGFEWRKAIEYFREGASEFWKAGLTNESCRCYIAAVGACDIRHKYADGAALFGEALSKMNSADTIFETVSLLWAMSKWGPGMAAAMSPDIIFGSIRRLVDPRGGKRELLALARASGATAKLLGHSADRAFLGFLRDIAASLDLERSDQMVKALALLLTQVPASTTKPALDDLLGCLGGRSDVLFFRTEDWLGDQWLVGLPGEGVPMVEIRCGDDVQQRVTAAAMAMLVLAQRDIVATAIEPEGWKRLSCRFVLFSEKECREKEIPLPKYFPAKVQFCVAYPADETRNDDKAMAAVFVGDECLRHLDMRNNPCGMDIYYLNSEVVSEILVQLGNIRPNSRKGKALRRKLMVEVFDFKVRDDKES